MRSPVLIPCPPATVLTAQEETTLIALAQQGRRDVLDHLLEIHLPCLEQVARRVAGATYCQGQAAEDLFQEACFYFCARGVDTYQINHPGESGYIARLWTWVGRYLPDALRDACVKWTRTPDEVRRDLQAVLRAQQELRALLDHEPTWREIAERANVKEAVVEAALQGDRTVPLDSGGDDEEEGTRIELPPPSTMGVRLALIDLGQLIFDVLGGPAAIRFLVLLVLREYGEYEWRGIVTLLRSGTADDPVWATALTDLPLPGAARLPWSQVVHLFSVPPPNLTESNLRGWYTRHLACVSGVGRLEGP